MTNTPPAHSMDRIQTSWSYAWERAPARLNREEKGDNA